MSDSELQRELWAAVGAGDTGRVREFVAAGADVNLPINNPGGETPLIRAIDSGDIEMVKGLLEQGADVNLAWKGPKSWTPLMFAHDNPEILQVLIAAGAKLESRATADSIRLPSGRLVLRPGGQTALHLAAMTGKAEAVRTLLRAGADVEARAEDGCAPLDYVVRLGAVTETAEALVEAGAQLTPQRLEAMHSAAHSPDSDLVNFIIPTDAANGKVVAKGSLASSAQSAGANETVKAPVEYRCPHCHAFIYSRKSKICGQCGALLPPELLLTDLQAQQIADERKWARELANKFSTHGTAADDPATASASVTSQAETVSTEALLRRISCVEEFRRRDRPTFWLYVMGYSGMFFVVIFLSVKLNLVSPPILLLIGPVFALLCLRAWNYASPVCPNCRNDIRICAASYCHLCGQPLSEQRCANCAVDSSWINIFRPYGNAGNFRWISFCPGCGVRLDAKVTRWSMGRRSWGF